jgi:hypothetical protein
LRATEKIERGISIVSFCCRMRIRDIVCMILGIIIFDKPLSAQSKDSVSAPPVIIFSGTSRITAESATPQPGSSGLKEPYARWEFEPALSIYDVPIGAHVLLTTENDINRNSMNSIEFVFDVNAFQKMLRDRVMAQAKATVTDYHAKAEEMQKSLSDPAVMQDLARYNTLRMQDSLGSISGEQKKELQDLQSKTADVRKMAETAARYASMNPAQMAKEKANDLRNLSQEISDPSKLEDKLSELNLFSGAEKFLYGFKNFGAGVTYPSFSPWVLSGVAVNGVLLEYSYGLLNVAATTGKMNSPLPDGRVESQLFNRKVVSAKLGLGANEATHLHFIAMYAADNPSTAIADSVYTPAKNYIIATNGLLNLFDKALSINGELAGSMFTRDITAPSIVLKSSQDKTGILNKLDPKISTSLDYAWTVGAAFNIFNSTTHGKASVQMIGPGYMTLGVPYLRSDIFGQDGELQQDLFDGKIKIGAYYKHNQDNVLPWKRTLVNGNWVAATTQLTSYGGTLDLQPNELPYLRIEYAPFLQQTDIDTTGSGMTNNTSLISATIGYDYRIGKLAGSTTGMIIVQNGTSSGGSYQFNNDIYNVNQTIIFTFPLTLSLYSETNVLNSLTTIASMTSTTSFQFSNTLRGTLGINYSSRNDGGYKFGFSLRSTIKFLQSNELELRVEKNTYVAGLAIVEPGYDQLRLRAVLSSRW